MMGGRGGRGGGRGMGRGAMMPRAGGMGPMGMGPRPVFPQPAPQFVPFQPPTEKPEEYAPFQPVEEKAPPGTGWWAPGGTYTPRQGVGAGMTRGARRGGRMGGLAGCTPCGGKFGAVADLGPAPASLSTTMLVSWRSTWNNVKGSVQRQIKQALDALPWVQKNPKEATARAADALARLQSTCQSLTREYATLDKMGRAWAETPAGKAAWSSYVKRGRAYQVLAAGAMSQVDRVTDKKGKTVAEGLCSVRTTPAFGMAFIPIALGGVIIFSTYGLIAWLVSQHKQVVEMESATKAAEANAVSTAAAVDKLKVEKLADPAVQQALKQNPETAALFQPTASAPPTQPSGEHKWVLPAVGIGAAALVVAAFVGRK